VSKTGLETRVLTPAVTLKAEGVGAQVGKREAIAPAGRSLELERDLLPIERTREDGALLGDSRRQLVPEAGHGREAIVGLDRTPVVLEGDAVDPNQSVAHLRELVEMRRQLGEVFCHVGHELEKALGRAVIGCEEEGRLRGSGRFAAQHLEPRGFEKAESAGNERHLKMPVAPGVAEPGERVEKPLIGVGGKKLVAQPAHLALGVEAELLILHRRERFSGERLGDDLLEKRRALGLGSGVPATTAPTAPHHQARM
jgi:hypothetical protein